MRILVVDDDADVLAAIADALREVGVAVLTATDGPTALQRWRDERPDLVVLDLVLPGLSGFEVSRAIHDEGSTPVILLGGQADDAIVRGFAAGVADYVAKPLRPGELIARIRAVARRAGIGEGHSHGGPDTRAATRQALT